MRLKLLRMTNSEKVYQFEEQMRDLSETKYYFISEGERKIVKVVQYEYVGIKRKINLLTIWDSVLYDPDNGTLLDDEISANGNSYKVFHAVLITYRIFE